MNGKKAKQKLESFEKKKGDGFLLSEKRTGLMF